MLESSLNNLILITTEKLGLINPAVVEKDVYVTNVLHALADVKNKNFQLVFIGGTCLAKAHRVVERMSEDIDFKIVPLFDKTLNSKAAREEISKFRKEILAAIEAQTGLAPKDGQITKGNNNKFTQVFLDYPSIYPANSALRQQIKIELTVQKAGAPFTSLPVASLVYEVLGDKSGMSTKSMPCVSLDETAVEKWVALNRRVADVERHDVEPDNAIIRHLFDLHCIHEKHGVGTIFEDLVSDVVLRDRERCKGKNLYFYENTLQEIAFGTEALNRNPAWEKRYFHFLEHMVFQKGCPTFQEALRTLDKLNQRAFGVIKNLPLEKV